MPRRPRVFQAGAPDRGKTRHPVFPAFAPKRPKKFFLIFFRAASLVAWVHKELAHWGARSTVCRIEKGRALDPAFEMMRDSRDQR